jgi:hypothetical protein
MNHRALVDLAFNLQKSAMGLNNVLYNGQSEASSS